MKGRKYNVTKNRQTASLIGWRRRKLHVKKRNGIYRRKAKFGTHDRPLEFCEECKNTVLFLYKGRAYKICSKCKTEYPLMI